ncbi:zinc ribbon domain-containing protein [Sphingopyxis sp. CCNWLW253]|uniref:zinc ribbon domain-containing protein n=1 Tax=unclassified Sphingopyxis TaxID=2614943 RepID=UPI003012CAAE
MANFCSECGSALSPEARFCATCGTAVSGPEDAAAPAASPAVVPAPSPATDVDVDAGDASPAPRRTGLLLGGAALLAVAIGGGAWLGLSSSGEKAGTVESADAGGEQAAAERAMLYAVAEANLRDRASLQGSKIVGSLKRGEKAAGTLATDERGKQWLKLDGGSGFISLANLAKAAPPVLASLDGSDRITTAQCSVLERAAAGAALKTTLKPGAAVRLVGATADGFTEIGLPGGGVGYMPTASACATEPSPAKGAVANSLIQFDARNCELGPELEPYFERARKARDGENIEEMAEEYDFPVDKKFRGLRVTAVIVGYEWQGVAFGDPASKVQAAFRQMGFTIDKNGDFAVDDDVEVSTTIRPTDAGSRSRGQSELICGV